MESLILLFTSGIIMHLSARKLQRYQIPFAKVSFLSHTPKFKINSTKSGDKIYYQFYDIENTTYGIISIYMAERHSLDNAGKILLKYLQMIRKPLGIVATYKIEKCQNGKDDVSEFVDYWQDEEGKDWKVKAYTNGRVISILYVKNIGNTSVKDHDKFLNGLRFS
ncbi:MAG: hypothetical protein ACM3VS_04780 [Candidatus Dadabacteria bacterium]